MAEAVLARDQDAREGQLAPRFNALVRKETCADVAREIELGSVLRLGKSEMSTGGRRKTALLGDAMEAVIAAVYVDGGSEAARAVVLRLWGDRVARVKAEDARDAKTALQEWAQARGMAPPVYAELSRSGPDHAPVFVVEARLEDGTAVEAEGARQAAGGAGGRARAAGPGGAAGRVSGKPRRPRPMRGGCSGSHPPRRGGPKARGLSVSPRAPPRIFLKQRRVKRWGGRP